MHRGACDASGPPSEDCDVAPIVCAVLLFIPLFVCLFAVGQAERRFANASTMAIYRVVVRALRWL
jgi:hypothetical protein